MLINSRPLISELKSFVASGITYKAKLEEQDDLVSACLLIVRMTQILADWDSKIFDVYSTNEVWDSEDYEPPMPIYISTAL
jgi:hypothetical protein